MKFVKIYTNLWLSTTNKQVNFIDYFSGIFLEVQNISLLLFLILTHNKNILTSSYHLSPNLQILTFPYKLLYFYYLPTFTNFSLTFNNILSALPLFMLLMPLLKIVEDKIYHYLQQQM